MKTQQETIMAIHAFIEHRISRISKNADFIQSQKDAAQTMAELRLWEDEMQRYLGSVRALRILANDIFEAYENPEILGLDGND